MWNQIKTVLLLGALSGLVLLAGMLIGGKTGLTIALILAVLMNFGMYFFSHKIVLMIYRAQPMHKKDHPQVHKMVEEIARQMQLPKPALYIIPTQTPNAFATGPSPKKAVVACTEGIMQLLDHEELRGVLAHELSHVANRDMLVTTIAATLAAVISYLAQMAQFAAIFGNRDERDGNLIGMLFLIILAPMIALVLQLAISRSREYLADRTGANTIKNGKALANALAKLEQGCKAHPMRGNPATSSLFITNPFTLHGIASLFSTHPATSERIKRLNQMKF
ncbi:zinc metalloprotease HtpX [Candidatus Woesearchaeota archaeon]|nr:zinc metalloprotease HtpX [Candidatus Woesearchaeota archaeon]